MDKITAVGLDLAKQIIQVHGIDGVERQIQMAEGRRDDVFHVVEHCDSAAISGIEQRLQPADTLRHQIGADADGEASQEIGHAESVFEIKRPAQEFWIEVVKVPQP